MSRKFIWTWRCDACGHEVEGLREVSESPEGETTLLTIGNLILITLEPKCENCGSMNTGKIRLEEFFDKH